MTPSARPSFLSHAATAAVSNRRELLCGNRRARSRERLRVPDETRVRMRLEIPGRADDQPIEVVRIALRLDEALAPAVRAGTEIRMRRRLAVIRRDDRLGGHRRHMLRRGRGNRRAFSGWPIAHHWSEDRWPVSVDAVA